MIDLLPHLPKRLYVWENSGYRRLDVEWVSPESGTFVVRNIALIGREEFDLAKLMIRQAITCLVQFGARPTAPPQLAAPAQPDPE